MEKIAVNQDKGDGADILEEDPNILCLTPQNFAEVTKDEKKDIFICLYNSTYSSKEITRVILAVQQLAQWFKTECPTPDLIIACFDRGTFEIPEVTPAQQEKIEEISKGEPYFVFFPMNSDKKGQRYSFFAEFGAFKMFLQSKSEAVKESMKK